MREDEHAKVLEEEKYPTLDELRLDGDRVDEQFRLGWFETIETTTRRRRREVVAVEEEEDDFRGVRGEYLERSAQS